MAAADEILGISGQMDISDIQTSLDKLCNDLKRVGIDTEALSQKMNKALNDVAKSDEDLSTKTTKAMQVLKSAMDETTKGIQIVPEMIENANKRVETIEGTIGKLNEQLSKTEKGSEAFGLLTKQIDSQKHSLEQAKNNVKDLVESYDGVKNSIAHVNGAYQALSAFSVASSSANSVQSATNIAVGATATTAAIATSAEAAAHLANSEAATRNAEAENQNVEATKHLSEALQQYLSVAYGRTQIEQLQSENTKELKANIELYKKAIKEIQDELNATDFAKNIEEATKKIEAEKTKIENYKNAIANLSPTDDKAEDIANYYNKFIEKAQSHIDVLQLKINEWEQKQQRLNADLQEYNTLLEAANSIQNGSIIAINVNDTTLSELTSKLDDSKQKLQELEAEVSKMDGKPLGEKQKENLQQLQSEIEKTKNNISVLQQAIHDKNEETFFGRLRNDISEIGQKVSDFGQSVKEKITNPIDELKSKVSGSSIGQRFGEEFAQAKSGLNDFKDGIINVMTANGKLQGEIGKVGDAFKALGIPVTGSLTAIKSVTKALWGMCATPIGAVIAAIALAFKAVHTWMTKSAEGQKVYTKLMAYFGSLASSITDIVITLGSYIYHCFADNNGTMKDFGNNFVKTFKTAVTAAVNLISGLGTTIKGVLNMDWDTFTDGLKKTWDGIKGAGETMIDAFKAFVTGAVGVVKTVYSASTDDKLGSNIGASFNQMFAKASQAASLAGKIQDTQIAIKKNSEEQLKLDEKIAEARNRIYTLQGKEKLAAIAETKELIKQKYDKQIQQQKQLSELHEKNAKLHIQSLASIAEERELRKDVLRTQIQQNAEQRMLIRQESSTQRSLDSKSAQNAKKNAKQEASVNSASGKLNEVIYKNEYARAKAELELEEELTDARIKAMEEGEEKVLAEQKHELQKEVEQIEQRKEAAIKAERDRQKAEHDARQNIIKAKGGKVVAWDDSKNLDDTLVQKIIKHYNEIEKNTVDAYNKSILQSQKENLYNYLKEYGDFESKKLAITEEYAEKIKKAQAAGNDIEVMRLQSEQKSQLNKIDTDNLLDRANMATIFQDFGLVMQEPLKQTLDSLQKYVQTSDFKKRSMEEQKSVYEAIDKANEALGNFDSTSIKELGMQVADYNNALAQQAITQRELAEATRDYVAAEKELIKAKLSNNENTIKEVQATYDDAKAKLTSAQANSDNANAQVIASQNKVNKSMSQFNTMLNKVSTSINSLKNGGLKTIWDLLGNKVQSNIGSFVSGAAALNRQITAMGETLANSGVKIGEFSDQISETIVSITSNIGDAFNKDEIKKLMQDGISSLFKDTFGDGNNFKGIQSTVGNFVGELIDSATSSSDAKNKVTDAVGNIIDKIASAGQSSGNLWGMIIGLILQLLDELADNGLSELIKELLERIGDAVEGFLKNLFTELIPAIIEGVVSALGSIGEGILGMVGIDTSGWFSNEEEIADRREALIAEAEKLTKSIDGLKDELSKQSGIKAIDTANELVELQKQKIENARQQLINENDYWSAHHSNASYWAENAFEVYDHGSWAEVTKALQEYKQKNANADTVTDSAYSYQDLLKLTPEQLDYIRTHYAGQWWSIKEVGKYNASDEKWEALADLAGTLDETMESLRESLTQTTFDSLKDNFISTLMDMDASAEDFSDKFSEYLQQAVVSAQVSDLLEDDLKKFYKDWAVRMQAAELSGNTLTTDDIDALKEQYDKIVQKGLEIREQAAAITGYTGSQSEQTATGKAIEAITEDQASTLIGIGYAMQIAVEQGNEVRNAISMDVSSLRLYAEQTANNVSEMRDIQFQGLEQLEAINRNTAPIILIREDIASMYKLMKDKY